MASAAGGKKTVKALPEPEGRHLARFVGFPFSGIEAGERIETTEFQLCRNRWALWVCPGGMTDEHPEYVSVFLAYKGEAPIRAWFQFTFIDAVGVRTVVFQDDDSQGSLFEGYDDHWGKHNCLLRSELEAICPDGEFAIEIGMYLPSKASAVMRQHTIPPSSLAQDFESLLESEIGADVTFIVGEAGERINAHKTIVIARCPAPIITENTMHLQEINIPDFDPDHFRELLRFIYTDRIASDVLAQMADELLSAATRFGLDRLKAMCEVELARNLEVDNVSDFMAIAREEEAKHLETCCMSFMCKYKKDVCKTEAFKRLADAHPQIMAELFAHLSSGDYMDPELAGSEQGMQEEDGPKARADALGGKHAAPNSRGGLTSAMSTWVGNLQNIPSLGSMFERKEPWHEGDKEQLADAVQVDGGEHHKEWSVEKDEIMNKYQVRFTPSPPCAV